MTGTIPESIVSPFDKTLSYICDLNHCYCVQCIVCKYAPLEWLETVACWFYYASLPDNINLPNFFLFQLSYCYLTGTIPHSNAHLEEILFTMSESNVFIQ